MQKSTCPSCQFPAFYEVGTSGTPVGIDMVGRMEDASFEPAKFMHNRAPSLQRQSSNSAKCTIVRQFESNGAQNIGMVVIGVSSNSNHTGTIPIGQPSETSGPPSLRASRKSSFLKHGKLPPLPQSRSSTLKIRSTSKLEKTATNLSLLSAPSASDPSSSINFDDLITSYSLVKRPFASAAESDEGVSGEHIKIIPKTTSTEFKPSIQKRKYLPHTSLQSMTQKAILTVVEGEKQSPPDTKIGKHSRQLQVLPDIPSTQR
ncbi:hypothetical protein HDU83_009374 [Entophlyctis luteolus]|nr:hypothetical protein HDU83_009374 [Entophlyctis luteolus]KAJ3390279.1 hypothetical protein HDU84_007660 [Entophlyctis sp. JEL0112]